MNSITEYSNENLDDFVFELNGQTYLNAAKKAKKLGDPRAIKFLQAYKDHIDKEFIDSEGPDKENDKFMIFYNADKKGIQRLKGLAKNERGGVHLTDNSRGTFFDIQNDKLKFVANVSVATTNDSDRQVFLRQSLIAQDNWKEVAKRLTWISDKINSIKASKPFTYIRIFTENGSMEFFYFIDDDEIVPVSINTEEGYHSRYNDDDINDFVDHLSDDDKKAINALCKAMNQNHKDI